MTKNDLLKYIDERLNQRSDGNIGLLMVRQYVADNMEDYHAQNLKAYAHDFDCTIGEAEKALTKGEEVPDTNVRNIISRQAAIDVLEERLQANGYSNVALVSELNRSIGYIMRLPSVQPEIIRCKDCKHFEYDHPYIIQGIPVLGHEVCNAWGGGCKTDENGYCFLAERRIDE